jgi:DNA repair protein RadA/Sms
MAKKGKTVFVCVECGYKHVKWQGQCSGCGKWNTVVGEEPTTATHFKRWTAGESGRVPLPLNEIRFGGEERMLLPDGELQRVFDGGLVEGSLTLLAGEPGIGKSTLLLQLALRLAPQTVFYVSGEESEKQIKMRAERLPLQNPGLYVFCETWLENILAYAHEIRPALLILDSIQTVYTEDMDATPGSVAQVRECAAKILRFAKDQRISVILVGHITKEGMIAGPKVLEHMVDAVLEFEGDKQYNYRIVRSVKNRFGRTPELGVYEMTHDGLREVANPSELFMTDVEEETVGTTVGATMQGARPILLETQALVTDSTFNYPQRSATGFDLRRMNMLLAVLEKRCGLKMGGKDVFINVAGGLKTDDPALDMAMACAIASSLLDAPVDKKTAFAGEVGLSGEIRPVARADLRLAEAQKLGFERIFLPAAVMKGLPTTGWTIRPIPVSKLSQALAQACV